MLDNPVITLTTDFGHKDPFVGIMKGIILGINPEVSIVDLSHELERYDVQGAARALSISYEYFPPQTIHVAVVDPGVGSSRRPILVTSGVYYFIGPDNGIFTSILQEGRETPPRVYEITSSHFFLPMRGSTFHGRDIFAPAAAWLSRGTSPDKFGRQIDDYITIPMPGECIVSADSIKGKIISIDHFGNAISNIYDEDISKLLSDRPQRNLQVSYNNKPLKLSNYYSENDDRNLSAIINSFGQLELYCYKENAFKLFDIKIGDSVIISLI